MAGDGKRRFCGHCNLHVHNLSAMSEKERADFIDGSESRSCIAYLVRPDGTMVTRSFWNRLLSPFSNLQLGSVAILATTMPIFFSSCTPKRVLGKPMPSRNSESIKIPDDKAPRMVFGELLPVKAPVEPPTSSQ